MSRARHGLDPAVGPRPFRGRSGRGVATLLATEGITGLLTGTPAGGLADLRNAHGSAWPAARSTSSSTARTCVAGREPSAISEPQAAGVRVAAAQLPGGRRHPGGDRGRPTSSCSIRPGGRFPCSCPPAPHRRLLPFLDAGPGMAGSGPADRIAGRALDDAGSVQRCRPRRPIRAPPPPTGTWSMARHWPTCGRERNLPHRLGADGAAHRRLPVRVRVHDRRRPLRPRRARRPTGGGPARADVSGGSGLDAALTESAPPAR